jgi:hypothetical protein
MSAFEIPGGGVQLDFSRDFCDRHREPLRERWPAGAGIAIVLLFDAFASDPRTIAMAPMKDGVADADALPRLVAECSPLCCFVGDEIMNEIMVEALANPPGGPRSDAIKARNQNGTA